MTTRTRTALFCLAAAGSLHAAEPARQPFRKDVKLPPLAAEENIWGAVLDSEVYRTASQDFADLRLVSSDGREIAYSLERATESIAHTVREPVPGRVTRLAEGATNRLEVVWELAADAPAGVTGLRFETPLRDFERRVTVTGEGDGTPARRLCETLLYDYTRFMDVRSTEARLPPNACRRFRIAIEEITDEQASRFRQISRTLRDGRPAGETEALTVERRPMRIDRISAWREKEVERVSRDRTAVYPVERFDVAQEPGRKRTVVTVHCRREPLTALSIETDGRNFSRECDLEAEGSAATDRATWVPVARATLSSIQFRSYATNALRIAFAPRRTETFRLIIHNGDNAPLNVTAVRAEGNVHRMVFLYPDAVPLRLRYGLGSLDPPRYDAAAVLAAVRGGNAVVEVGLGPETRDSGVAAGRMDWRQLLNSRSFFVAVVLVVVAVLGWGLFRAARQSGAEDSGPRSGNPE